MAQSPSANAEVRLLLIHPSLQANSAMHESRGGLEPNAKARRPGIKWKNGPQSDKVPRDLDLFTKTCFSFFLVPSRSWTGRLATRLLLIILITTQMFISKKKRKKEVLAKYFLSVPVASV